MKSFEVEGLKVVTKNFFGTTEEWRRANPILYLGVWAFEKTRDGKILAKVGDGKTRWNELKYFDAENLKGLPEDLKRIAAEAIAEEAQARQEADRELSERIALIDPEAVANESIERQRADSELRQAIDERIQATNDVLDGVQFISLSGALLSRVINGTTEIAKNLFPLDTVFATGKTLINDTDGTVGVYAGDIDSAFINVITKSNAPVGKGESIYLGVIPLFDDLPQTVEVAVELFKRTPKLDDYAVVQVDETMQGRRVEWYITDITDGEITWGNPVPINTGDYQEQSTGADEGLVLTGGERSGTYGRSIPIETEPTENSNNLVSSGGIWAWFGAALNSLKTTAKTVIGAINELFDSKLNKADLITLVRDTFYPVKKIYMTTDPANPGTYMGGTWILWGQGRVPVGVDTTQDEFDEVEKLGGEKDHTLKESEMPAHTHIQNSHNHSLSISTENGNGPPVRAGNTAHVLQNSPNPIYSGTATNEDAGGDQPHNNLQPYITCYMWKRTA